MTRNPNKTPCQHPGCRNWAMRGHTLCRSHRDPELGPRSRGEPRSHPNAHRTADHAHPLPSLDLVQLVKDLARARDGRGIALRGGRDFASTPCGTA
jgi:hypothetical protein